MLSALSKKEWNKYIGLPILGGLIVDVATKMLALRSTTQSPSGWLSFVFQKSYGLIGSAFMELPGALRTASYASGGILLCVIFFGFQYLFTKRAVRLRGALSVVMAGLLGNALDRVRFGYTIDFIVLGPPGSQIFFNIADLLQWAGVILVAVVLVIDYEEIFRRDERRRAIWIDHDFQFHYCMRLMNIGLGFALTAGALSFVCLRLSLSAAVPEQLQARVLFAFGWTYSCMTIVFSIFLFFVGLFLSHRTIGPIRAFERFVDDWIDGRDTRLKLRVGDQLPKLEKIADKLCEYRAVRKDGGKGQDRQVG